MKILIAVPCMDQVPAQFAQALATLNKVDGECLVAFQIGSLIYHSRDALARKAIECEADYILWLDSDMVFPPDTLARLLEDRESGDIITGLYFRRVHPFSPVLFDKLEIENGKCDWTAFEKIPDDLFEVGGCGFGCVLMKTDIIFEISARFSELFSPIGRIGEDISFCWRARQCGYKIVCDPKISLGHVGHHVVTRDFYETYTKRK